MNKTNKTQLIVILGLLSAIGPFSIDMYLPAFPEIAESLYTSPQMVGYSLSSYFIGICVGQLVIGPLLDRYGRKPPLYGGLILYIAAALGCAFAPTIEWLIFFRFFQAAGGCAGMVTPRAIIRDVFPVHENAKIFSMLILILGVSPIIAPTVGGYASAHFGWHTVFLLLAIITFLILIASMLLLPESKAADASFSLKPRPILRGFAKVIRDPQFYTYAFTGSLASAGLYAYLAGSPFVFMELYHVTGQHYGWIFALVAGGLITSSQINNLLLNRYSSERIITAVLTIQSIVALVLVAGTYFGFLELYGIIACIFCYLCCQGFSFPNSSALSMAPFAKGAGSASALLGAIQMAIGAFSSAMVGVFSNGTAFPMTAVMAICSWLALTILFSGKRILLRHEKNRVVQEGALVMVERS